MSSKAQKFAQKRNTAGGTLKGVVINLEKNVLPVATNDEKENIAYALTLLNESLDYWKENYEEAKKKHL